MNKMVANGTGGIEAAPELGYDRQKELKAFDDTKAGVKGLVDAGILKIPRIFVQPADGTTFDKVPNNDSKLSFPVIDLSGIDKDPVRLKETVEKVCEASGSLGFFHVVNHGIPIGVLEEMKAGVCGFFEQDTEVKKQWYTRDYGTKSLAYNTNVDLYKTPVANWRDTIYCIMAPKAPNPEELPEVCRDILMDYSKQVKKLGCSLLELLSEALGLNKNYLKDIGCAEGIALICHYYPACPQPELTIGTRSHADTSFITILLQDQIGGLQVFHQDQWVDVPPLPGAIVVNIGDFLQLISNDKFKSANHRVLANKVGPRISVASFYTTGLSQSSRLYEPIKELLSEDHPPKYRPTSVKEYTEFFRDAGVTETTILSHFQL